MSKQTRVKLQVEPKAVRGSKSGWTERGLSEHDARLVLPDDLTLRSEHEGHTFYLDLEGRIQRDLAGISVQEVVKADVSFLIQNVYGVGMCLCVQVRNKESGGVVTLPHASNVVTVALVTSANNLETSSPQES